jgi:hypothetical protein
MHKEEERKERDKKTPQTNTGEGRLKKEGNLKGK